MFCKQQMPLETQTEYNTDTFHLCICGQLKAEITYVEELLTKHNGPDMLHNQSYIQSNSFHCLCMYVC